MPSFSKLACIREVTGITPSIYVGATGTFFSDPLADGNASLPPRQATGTVEHIKVGPNYAVFSVRVSKDEVVLLRR